MKKILLFAITIMAAQISFGQNTTVWPATTTLNAKIGINTKPTSSSTAVPNFDLQVHGTTDYFEDDAVTGLAQDNEGNKPQLNTEKILQNLGKTSRIGLTNTITGLSNLDGTVLRMSGTNFTLQNFEAGDIAIKVPNVSMLFSSSSKRIFVGGLSSPTSTTYANFNIAPSATENGMYIHNTGTGTYGMAIRTAVNSNDAIQVIGYYGINVKKFSVKGTGEVNSGNISVSSPASSNAIVVTPEGSTNKNFKVTSGGQVFARQYTTTAGIIPDYVFDPSYKLLPLNELKTYITTNKHLPNIPSAKEYEERGELDLGELNRKLLEKVEELTLYILQLEERTKALENK
jgi:hypothetical protein